jgi:hypothetical protein
LASSSLFNFLSTFTRFSLTFYRGVALGTLVNGEGNGGGDRE